MKHIIDFIEANDMVEKISHIKEYALNPKIGEDIKNQWRKENRTHCTNGLLYSTRNGKIIAIIPDSIKAFPQS